MAHANPKNRKKNLNASFVSNVERFRNSECEQPPVGQYELNYYNIDKGPKRANNVRSFLVKIEGWVQSRGAQVERPESNYE
jgi:hypothetical protein